MNKEEREFEKLRELGLKLHVPIPETFLTLEVFDKDGNPVCPKCSSPIPKDKEVCPNCATEAKYHQRGHSWVRNAYNFLFSNLAGKNASDSTFGAGKLNIKRTSGTIDYGARGICLHTTGNLDTSTPLYGYLADSGQDTRGILIGTGTNAESFEDYFLQTQIVNGTSSGEISHVQSQPHSVTYTAGTKVLKNDLIRYFNNNSGGSIAVNEVAIVTTGNDGAVYSWLQARELLGATVTVADTGQLQVKFTIQITYPS